MKSFLAVMLILLMSTLTCIETIHQSRIIESQRVELSAWRQWNKNLEGRLTKLENAKPVVVDLTPMENRLHDVECDKATQVEMAYERQRLDVLEQWARDMVEWSEKESSWVNQYFCVKGQP